MVAEAALLKQTIEKAKIAEPLTATDLRLREKGVNNFALRCFDALSHDREISGVQVASVLLQLPTYYTINYNFTRINLWWLGQSILVIIQPENNQNNAASDPMAEEPCVYETGDTTFVSIFDNYQRRGPHLARMNSRVRRLWSRKTVIIVDGVSMLDLRMVTVIDINARSPKPSTDPHLTISVASLSSLLSATFSSFHLFWGPALWNEPRRAINEDDENGRLLWHQFKDVIILDEHMRQIEGDAPFRDILSRVRTGTLTEAESKKLSTHRGLRPAGAHSHLSLTMILLNGISRATALPSASST